MAIIPTKGSLRFEKGLYVKVAYLLFAYLSLVGFESISQSSVGLSMGTMLAEAAKCVLLFFFPASYRLRHYWKEETQSSIGGQLLGIKGWIQE